MIGVRLSVIVFFILWAWVDLRAQTEKPLVFLEGEAGVVRFTDPEISDVFPAGAGARVGAAFAMARQNRLWVRPQAGVKWFANTIDENITEQLVFAQIGGQLSYDVFFAGQTTFFPYVSFDMNWVSNFDAESYGGEDTRFSDTYLRGFGFSQEIGLRVQRRDWYIKAGYEFFNPTLRAKRTLIEEDWAAGYITPESHGFRFSTLNISIGFSVLP